MIPFNLCNIQTLSAWKHSKTTNVCKKFFTSGPKFLSYQDQTLDSTYNHGDGGIRCFTTSSIQPWLCAFWLWTFLLNRALPPREAIWDIRVGRNCVLRFFQLWTEGVIQAPNSVAERWIKVIQNNGLYFTE